MPLHKTIKQNENGQIIILGDVHGRMDIVNRALEAVNFNPETDKCISVGDLIDKGPDSLDCLRLLKEDWFDATEGNHERILRDIMESPSLQKEAHWRENGGSWWFDDITKDERLETVELVNSLPIAITVERSDGSKIGIVHAHSPSNDWGFFLKSIEDDGVQKMALWSRDKIDSNDESNVSGVDLVIVGHTPVQSICNLGNTVYIDTNLHASPGTDGPLPYLDDSKLDELIWNLSPNASRDDDFDIDDELTPDDDSVNYMPTL